MDDYIAGIVKAGEAISLGWNYYEERKHVLVALVDFDAKKDMTDFRQQVLDDGEVFFDIEEFYIKVVDRWVTMGFVKEISIKHEYIGATVASTPVSNVNDAGWHLIDSD